MKNKNKWQSRDRFLVGNVPVVLESTWYICIVRSGGKNNSLCCFLNSKRLHICGSFKNLKPAAGNDWMLPRLGRTFALLWANNILGWWREGNLISLPRWSVVVVSWKKNSLTKVNMKYTTWFAYLAKTLSIWVTSLIFNQ